MDIVKEYEAEPTLYDVIEAMQNGFSYMEKKLEAWVEEIRNERAEFKDEMNNVRRRQFKLELKDEDRSDTIQNHEERLMGLEKWKKGFGKKGMAGA